MARVFITGSTDGIGLAAAQLLAQQGHKVTLHARSSARGADALRAVPGAEAVLIGDLGDSADTRRLADEAAAAGPWDAVVHNAGIGPDAGAARRVTPDGPAAIFQVNSLAPYVLSAVMLAAPRPPCRLLFVSSSMHAGGSDDLSDPGWRERAFGGWSAYSDTKLQNVILANYVARKWRDVQTCSFDPGWVQTKLAMGGAPGVVATPAKAIAAYVAGTSDLVGQQSGVYFSPSGIKSPHKSSLKESKQEEYVKICTEMSGVSFPN